MAAKNKVVIKIMDREYPLVSEDSREHMQRIANYVDDIMRETQSGNKKLSISMVAVLTALNIADDYFKLIDEKEYIEKRLNSPKFELKEARDELTSVVTEFERRSLAYENLVEEFSKIIDSSAIYETGLTKLKKRMEKLEKDLEEKDRALEISKENEKRLEEEIVIGKHHSKLTLVDSE